MKERILRYILFLSFQELAVKSDKDKAKIKKGEKKEKKEAEKRPKKGMEEN